MTQFTRQFPRSTLFVTLFSPVFFACFGFPFINITQPSFSVINSLLLVYVLFGLGKLAAARLPWKSLWPTLGLFVLLTLAGFACRIAMEWGEVSIRHDFTLPNIAVHLIAVTTAYGVGCYAGKE